jgi:hypothetical protein
MTIVKQARKDAEITGTEKEYSYSHLEPGTY